MQRVWVRVRVRRGLCEGCGLRLRLGLGLGLGNRRVWIGERLVRRAWVGVGDFDDPDLTLPFKPSSQADPCHTLCSENTLKCSVARH